MLVITDLLTRMNNQKVHVCVENGNLRVDSGRKLTNEQRKYLKQFKQKIIEHLIDEKLEAAEERAAIMEYDGCLPKDESEKYAIEKHLKPFFFECTDGGDTFLTSQCNTLEEARVALEFRFGDKLIKMERKR